MLFTRLNEELKNATRNGNSVVRDTLRLLLSALNYKKIDLQHDLGDDEILNVINNEAKKRRESIDIFSRNGRSELAEKEKAELSVLEQYLPKQLSRDEIRQELSKIELPKDFGAAMKIATPMFKGRADGKLVAEIIRTVIQ